MKNNLLKIPAALIVSLGLASAAGQKTQVKSVVSSQSSMHKMKQTRVHESKDMVKHEMVNINTANRSMLMSLPHVGQKTANAIILRRAHMRFTGPKNFFNRMKDWISHKEWLDISKYAQF